MDAIPFGTWYVSRRLALSLPDAARALDTVVIPPDAGHSTCRLAALTVVPTTPIPGVARRLRGRLGLTGLTRALPVELELAGWSSVESELGLRPLRRPGVTRTGRYFDAAAGSVDHVAQVLLASARASSRPEEIRTSS